MHGLLRRPALAVDGDAGYVLGPAGGEHGGPGDAARLHAERADAAPDHVVDETRIEPDPVGERAEHVGGQRGRVHSGQCTVPFADRGPDGVDNDCVAHGNSRCTRGSGVGAVDVRAYRPMSLAMMVFMTSLVPP